MHPPFSFSPAPALIPAPPSPMQPLHVRSTPTKKRIGGMPLPTMGVLKLEPLASAEGKVAVSEADTCTEEALKVAALVPRPALQSPVKMKLSTAAPLELPVAGAEEAGEIAASPSELALTAPSKPVVVQVTT